VDYNRSINAAIIGHVLTFWCMFVSYRELYTGTFDGYTLSFILATLSLACAYVAETTLVMLRQEDDTLTRRYYNLYRLCQYANTACPVLLVVAYVVLFFKLIGV
jgi:hypothetical protein